MLCLQEDQWTLVFTGGSLNCVVFAGGSVDSCVYWRITELCCVCRRISGLVFTGGSLNCVVFAGGSVDLCLQDDH